MKEFVVEEVSRTAHFAYPDLTNPTFTQAYLDAMSSLGSKPVVIGFRKGGEFVCGCYGFLRSGRLSRALEIPSLPLVPRSFWDGLLSYCHKLHISHLSLNTYGSYGADIPRLPGEMNRASRWEFCIDLTQPNFADQFGKEHRRLARRAKERGMQLTTGRGREAMAAHLHVNEFSAARRKERGEDVGAAGTRTMAALLDSGVGKIFQAVQDGEVLSSILVTRAERGAYLFAAGTSSHGMKLGASHFLIAETAELMQREGCVVFNLGGVDDLHSGLAAYKSHFGRVGQRLESAEFYIGARLQHKLYTWAHRLLTDPGALVTIMAGKASLWKIFAGSPAHLARTTLPSNVSVSKLSDGDLSAIPMPTWLRREQEDRIRRLGFNGAYAAYCDNRLAHISWLIPSDRENPKTLGLHAAEAEISACITLPEFRGRNLYPSAISVVASNAGNEVQTIYMKTNRTNLPSQRGIVKAGLRPCGWVCEYKLPKWLGARVVRIRSFRWSGKRVSQQGDSVFSS